MKYLHTMLRINDVKKSLDFFVNALGLKEVRRIDVEEGRFSLIFLAADGNEDSQIELTHNWDGDKLGEGCLLYTSPSPRDLVISRMPSSA